MIIKNTPENKLLVRRLRNIVNEEPGFRGKVDCTWNCGDDIRFEIASIGWDAPLIVSTCVHPEGRFEIKVRLYVREALDAAAARELTGLLQSVETMRTRIEKATLKAKPTLSDYYNDN